MPRSKEFDPDAALERAMKQFWSTGYEATSVQALVEATGLNRSSLYETFGCKHDLYLAALERYRSQVLQQLHRQLEAEGSPLKHLRTVFEQARQAPIEGAERGCFLVDATVERACLNADTNRRTAAGHSGVEDAFAEAIARAQHAGEIEASRDPVALGRFLANVYRGIQVAAKLSPSRAVFDDIIETTFASL